MPAQGHKNIGKRDETRPLVGMSRRDTEWHRNNTEHWNKMVFQHQEVTLSLNILLEKKSSLFPRPPPLPILTSEKPSVDWEAAGCCDAGWGGAGMSKGFLFFIFSSITSVGILWRYPKPIPQPRLKARRWDKIMIWLDWEFGESSVRDAVTCPRRPRLRSGWLIPLGNHHRPDCRHTASAVCLHGRRSAWTDPLTATIDRGFTVTGSTQ